MKQMMRRSGLYEPNGLCESAFRLPDFKKSLLRNNPELIINITETLLEPQLNISRI